MGEGGNDIVLDGVGKYKIEIWLHGSNFPYQAFNISFMYNGHGLVEITEISKIGALMF